MDSRCVGKQIKAKLTCSVIDANEIPPNLFLFLRPV